MLVFGAAAAALGAVFFRARFGGMTGDTLGAAIAIAEAALLALASR